ncbi:MAG: hypothetical protein R6X13_03265 [bacterium]
MVASTGIAFQTDYSLDGVGTDQYPGLCLRAEPLSAGIGLGKFAFARVAYMGAEAHRFRAGIAIADLVVDGARLLPLYFGYTIYQRSTSFRGGLHGKLPEVYVEASASYITSRLSTPPDYDFVGTLAVTGAVDVPIAGVGVTAGLVYLRVSAQPNHQTPGYNEFRPYVAVQASTPVIRFTL